MLRICRLVEVKKNVPYKKWFDELNDEVLIYYRLNDLKAISGICPHFGGELNVKKEHMQCKWHGWTFDQSSGACLTHSDMPSLKTYTVKVIDDEVYVIP